MFQRLLVPLDGSANADQVLPRVEALAKAFRSHVTLLRATESPERLLTETAGTLPVGAPAAPVVDVLPLVAEQRREAVAYLESIAKRLQEQGVTVDSVQPEGTPAETVLQQARERDADLIAMTTHGRGGLGRLVFGSVADAVLRQAPCPVLLVRVQEV